MSLWIFGHPGAQSQTPSLISAGGGCDFSEAMGLSWSLGELAVLTWHDDAALCTEGFQQPYMSRLLVKGTVTVPYLTNRSPDPDVHVEASPNPFQSNISLSFSRPLLHSAYLTVYSPMGQVVYKEQIPAGNRTKNIDSGSWHPGVYYLQLFGTADELSTAITLIKL